MNRRPCLIASALLLLTPVALNAQSPGSIADAELERQKILKAADQMEVLTHKVETMQLDINRLKESIAKLKVENTSLKNEISLVKQNAEQEREALLSEIGKIISEGGAETSAPAQQASEGYEHVVQKGPKLMGDCQCISKTRGKSNG